MTLDRQVGLVVMQRARSPLNEYGMQDIADRLGWEADRRLRMRNAEWPILTLIEATLVEATLVRMTHRLRRFANMR
jgi:hypothetical protein